MNTFPPSLKDFDYCLISSRVYFFFFFFFFFKIYYLSCKAVFNFRVYGEVLPVAN